MKRRTREVSKVFHSYHPYDHKVLYIALAEHNLKCLVCPVVSCQCCPVIGTSNVSLAAPSCPVVSCPFLSCAARPCPLLGCHLLCRVLPCPVVLCPALPSLPLRCVVPPRPVYSCLSSPLLCCFRAVPCRAVPCRAVPCRAVPCRAVPCRAVLCIHVCPLLVLSARSATESSHHREVTRQCTLRRPQQILRPGAHVYDFCCMRLTLSLLSS